MAQMWLLWRPKTTTAAAATTTTADAVSATTHEMVESGGENCFHGCLKKLVKKLRKRQGRLTLRVTASRQSSFQCRYDPLSYALNFDASGDDEDYYQFCAFSSRFVTNPRTSPRVAAVATSH